MKDNNHLKVIKYLGFITQVGFGIVFPPIIMLYLANFINGKFSLGVWFTVLMLLIGFYMSARSLISFFKYFFSEATESEKKFK